MERLYPMPEQNEDSWYDTMISKNKGCVMGRKISSSIDNHSSADHTEVISSDADGDSNFYVQCWWQPGTWKYQKMHQNHERLREGKENDFTEKNELTQRRKGKRFYREKRAYTEKKRVYKQTSSSDGSGEDTFGEQRLQRLCDVRRQEERKKTDFHSNPTIYWVNVPVGREAPEHSH
uniref:Uncharacterized protein n=1 Tax=Nelumbo nucifera TaxID=4432 RepID=A0A822Y1P4_NELNU|nr:TPA_asm: hypothetical protein HUJ06_028008 [Nelumbo nucifera]